METSQEILLRQSLIWTEKQTLVQQNGSINNTIEITWQDIQFGIIKYKKVFHIELK